MRSTLLATLCLSSAFGLWGCSSGKTGPTGGPPPSAALQEVAGLISSYSGEYKKGPTKVTDLARYENGYPIGYLNVKNGDIVVVWGVKMILEEGGGAVSPTSDVIAYEKSVPTAGGNVLLANGQVKTMSADEFKSAPKAKK